MRGMLARMPPPVTSGEWVAIQSALTESIQSLRTEFQSGVEAMRSEMRGEFHLVNERLNGIGDRLAQGATTMALQKQEIDRHTHEIEQARRRSDEHSDMFRDLPTAAPPASSSAVSNSGDKTWRFVKSKALETAVSAIVLGACAVAYNVWRDATIKDEVESRVRSAMEHHASPAASPRPSLPLPAAP